MKLSKPTRMVLLLIAVCVAAGLVVFDMKWLRPKPKVSHEHSAIPPGMEMKMPEPAKSPGPAPSQPAPAQPAPEVPGRGMVELDLAQRQFINIRTKPVTRDQAAVKIRTVGIVTYDETRITNVNTRVMGWAEKLYVDKPGQWVDAGSPMMDIYSPDLYSAQHEYLLSYRHCLRLKHILPSGEIVPPRGPGAEVQNESVTLLQSARKRLRLWGITDGEIRALETSGEPSDTLQLPAPVSGYVIEKGIDPAQMVRPGMVLYRVADLSTVWINADLYEFELPLVKTGQKAVVTAVAYPGRTFDATVDFIFPYSERKTRTTKVRLVMDNREELFKPDTYVNVELEIDQGEHLMVPAPAVFDTGTRQYVFVEVAEGHFMPRRIQLGPKSGDQWVVREGLKEGESVVVDGNFLLDSESQLRAAGSGGGHHHGG